MADNSTPKIVANNGGRLDMPATPEKEYQSDVLVAGTGFAGVFAALEARRNGLSVVMVDKGALGWSGMSPWASDARPFDPTIYDRDEWHRNLGFSTEWLYDRRWMDIYFDESLDIFHTLHKWGTHDCKPFERAKVFRKLLKAASVRVVERTMLTSLLQDDSGAVAGAVGFKFDDERNECSAIAFRSRAVILCTGAGGYKAPGFPAWGQTFDGDAMAYAVGATITGKEFHDTHNTFSTNPADCYQKWEWVQSEVGNRIWPGPPESMGLSLDLRLVLLAHNGIARPWSPTSPAGSPPPPNLDNSKYLNTGFLDTPGIHPQVGITAPPFKITKEMGHPIGGATVGMGVHKGEGVFNSDYSCRADGVTGLYAAGDALGSMMCGPVYPAPGFSHYGSAIQGRRAARFASEFVKAQATPPLVSNAVVTTAIKAIWAPFAQTQGFDPGWVTEVLRSTMSPFQVLYIKSPRRLDGALASIEYMRSHVVPKMIAENGHQLRLAHEAANMLLNAEMKLRAGLYRTESRGTHFREDYPARDDRNWRCFVLIKNEGGRMVFSKHPLPLEWAPPAELPYRQKYPRVFPGEDQYLQDHPQSA